MGKKETLIGLEKFEDLSFDINGKAIEGEGTFTEPDTRTIKYDGDVEDFNELGQVFRSENIDKRLAANQSGWEQLGSFAVQSLGEVVGGTISGVGAIGGAFQAAYAEYKDEDASFNNGMIQLGEDIKAFSKNVAPIYRENKGKSWDLSDSGWWFENAVSFASTASMLIPSYGAVKGLGYLGKLLKLTDKVGDTTKYLAKIGTGAVVSRNAENFTESLQVVNNVKSDLSKRFEDDAEFEKIANSAVGQELAAEGREVTKESLTNFIASKAGWKSYQVNSINVIFDALQMSAAFKNPMTRKGLFGASSAEKAAEKALLSGETAVKQSFAGRLGDIGKTIARTTYLQSSEGVEEGINYMGTLAGENLAKELTGKEAEDIDWGQLTESAFWGALGGIANTAGASAYKAATGTPSGKAQRDASVNEIKNRLNFIDENNKKFEEIASNNSLNDEEKKVLIAQEKQQSIAYMTFKAANNRNVDGVLSMVNNPKFKKTLVDKGYETEENIDKAIVKINTEVLQAEKHYKTFANNFQTQNIDGQLKAQLIFQGANISFFNDKLRERQNSIANELTELKNNDAFFDENSSPNLENTVQLAALKYANQAIKANIAKQDNATITKLMQQRIEENNAQIATLEEAFKNTEKADISKINPKITEIQVESILLGNQTKTNGQFVNEQVLNKDRVKEREAELAQKRKDEVLKKENEFKANVEKDLVEGKTNVQELKNLKTTANKSLHSFLDEKIKQLELTQKAAQDTAVVQNAKNPDPVNNSEAWKKDNILSKFADDLEQQIKVDVNEENLNPALKEEIDNYLAGKSHNFDLMESLYLVKKPSTKDLRQYLINKLLERKENFGKTETEAIKEVNITPVESNTELEFNEDTYSELQGNKPVTTQVDLDEDAGIEYNVEKEINPTNTLIGIGAFPILTNKKENPTFVPVKHGVKMTRRSKNFRALKNLKTGDKLFVSVDTKNQDYKDPSNYAKYEDYLNDVPLKVEAEIEVKGKKELVIISYISRPHKINPNYISEKDEVVKLRKAVTSGGTITVTVAHKSDGSVVNTPTWQSIDKVGLGDSKFYAIKPGSGNSYLSSLESIATGKADKVITTKRQGGFGVISKFSELQVARDIQLGKTINREGTVYILLQGMNGTTIASPVVPSKLNRSQAVGLEKTLVSLVKELGKSEAINRQEINDLVDKVKDLINVDKRTEGRYADETAKSFRYYAKKGDKQARLELVYRVVGEKDFGKKRTLVIRENGIQIYQEEPTGEKDANGNKIYKKELVTKNNKSLFSFDTKAKGTEETLLSKVLEAKHYNLDFTRLGTDEAYTKKTIEGGHILTNVGQVFDENGEAMGNFIGESNSFKLMINTNLNEYGVNNEAWNELSEEVKQEIIAQNKNC